MRHWIAMSCKGSVSQGCCKRSVPTYSKPGGHSEIRKDSLQRGLPISDEASARQNCLYKGVDVPDLAMEKDFLRFYIATSRGKIDENERHRADSVNAFAERFFAGFTRITGTPTDEGDRSEVYNESALR
jgi:hypothetical protein